MSNVCVVILNYNSSDLTGECLGSLVKRETSNSKVRVILIDNGSRKSEGRKLRNYETKFREKLDIKLIENKENLGFAGGNNVGIKYALGNGADYVLLLNNDTVVQKDFMTELVKIARGDNKAGIVTPKIYFEAGYEFHEERYKREDLGKVIWAAGGVMDWDNVVGFHRGVDEVDRGQYDEREEVDYASGCCFLVKRKVFDKIGVFDERYFLYYEDADFCERVKKAGYKIVYTPKSVIWHKNAGSGGGSGSGLQDYYITRNRLLFGLKYAPWRARLALIKESLKLLRSGRRWQRFGVRDFYLLRFGKGSYG